MTKLKNISVVLMLLILFTAMNAGCSKRGEEGAGGEGTPPAGPGGAMRGEERLPRVETAEAGIGPIVLEKQYVGEIKPLYSVDLRSTASGWLTSINVDTGDRIGKNGIVCVIEHDDVAAQAEQAEANISVSKASVARAEAELERVLIESRRAEILYEKGYVSKWELEQAQTADKQARAALDSAKGQLAQSEAQLKNVMVKLRDSTMKAPFSGVVAERYVDPGAYVSPANPIIRLVDDSKVKAVVNVVEEDFPHFREGAAAAILADSYPGEKFEGQIVRIAPALDSISRTAMVEILLPNPDGRLRGGMTARVSLVAAENPSALKIPESALRKNVETGDSFVFVVSGGVASMRDVKIGILAAGEVEIVEGLEPGDAVITGDVRISEGMKVELMSEKGGPR
ncbi:MAG: efflux RND transporter periplasmic adaptor subunit [bacterium]